MMKQQVIESIDLPESMGRVVVFDGSVEKQKRLSNLVCFDAKGGIKWTAELPENTSPDCFTGVKIDGETLSAYTWSCLKLTLDMKTGATLETIFTK